MNPYLFTYGWLQRKYQGSAATHTPTLDCEFVANGHARGQLYQVSSYSGAIFSSDSNTPIFGEILRLIDPLSQLPLLDEFEHAEPLISSHADYRRILIPINTEKGSIVCWAYELILPTLGLPIIASGRFDS